MCLNVHLLAHLALTFLSPLVSITLYTYFIRILLRWRTRSIVKMLTLLIPWKCVLSCITRSWISLSCISLFKDHAKCNGLLLLSEYSCPSTCMWQPCNSIKSRCAITKNIHAVQYIQ